MSWSRVSEMLSEATDFGEPDDFTEASYGGIGGGRVFDGPGRSQWLVFEDADDAESAAVDYVKDMLDDDASMFNQTWLSNFISVSPTDARIIAQENADSYWGNLDDDRAIEEANLEDELEELTDERDEAEEKMAEAEEKHGDTEDKVYEAKEGSPRWRNLVDRIDKLDKRIAEKEKIIDAFDDKVEKLAEQAREDGAEAMASEEYEYIRRDPLGWWEDQGLDGSLIDQNFGWLDFDAAAQDAVDTDGVAHFLAGYDGNEYDLEDDFVAFRQN